MSKYGLPFQSTSAKKTKGKTAAVKVYQKRSIVLGYKKIAPDVYPLADFMILIDGNIRYMGTDDEMTIRGRIRDLLVEKDALKNIMVNEFDFVRVSNKKIRKPDGNVPFDALGMNTVYPTGAIYTRRHRSVNQVLLVK